MRRVFFVSSLSLILSALAANYRPDRDGALTTVSLDVVDDEGLPVAGAKAFFRVFTSFDKCYKVMRDTDSRGRCEMSGTTRGEITVVVSKDGYYTSCESLKYRDLSWDETVVEHKWTRSSVQNHIIMKKVRKPFKQLTGGFLLRDPPEYNAMMPFDLFKADWCEPFGKGKSSDIELGCYEWTNAVNARLYGVRLVATNCVDGFVLGNTDEWSRFKYALAANDEATYEKEIAFGYVPNASGKLVRHADFTSRNYLIFRIRTVTNEIGKITRANYGILNESLRYQGGLSLGIHVNPNNNDTSLEHDWAYKHMKKAP